MCAYFGSGNVNKTLTNNDLPNCLIDVNCLYHCTHRCTYSYQSSMSLQLHLDDKLYLFYDLHAFFCQTVLLIKYYPFKQKCIVDNMLCVGTVICFLRR